MQKLNDQIVGWAEKASQLDPEKSETLPDLHNTASDWATYCCQNLSGDLLRRGLRISESLTMFANGLMHPETLSD